jgi:hypothetical protein
MGVTTDTATTAATIGIAITGIIIVAEFGLPVSMVVAGIIAIGETPELALPTTIG